MPSPFTA
ncbi:Protein of unknown function [Pyronema omphalodes CBS 100304]|nr:Protein of unknown function [Pyronema omphalodes CBS 100304]